MRIGIISNPMKDLDHGTAIEAAREIVRHGGTAVVGEEYRASLLAECRDVEIAAYDTCSAILCLGGDGTFLSAVQSHYCSDIPLVGVNLGSLGFLAEIKPARLSESILAILESRFQIENRMMLSVTTRSSDGQDKGRHVALNDAVVSRGGISRILTVDLYLDGHHVETVPGDGIIVASPTGSTGYSLSAGGPIVRPDLGILLVTPICPHTLHNRSYITSSDGEVEIVIGDYPYHPVLTVDGRVETLLEQGDHVVVRQADKPLRLLRLGASDFYGSLPGKIYARGGAQERDKA
jgi:NAD+ kinase